MARRKYIVVTTHKNWAIGNGQHTAEVNDKNNCGRYVVIDGFGCSRDYRVDTDHDAIRQFLAEHGCKVTNIKPI